MFSAIDDEYLTKTTLLVFPYLLACKSGISKEMFSIVYDISMLTTKGISGTISNVLKRRQKRYYYVKALVAVTTEAKQLQDPSFSPPGLPTVKDHLNRNSCFDEETIQEIRLERPKLCFRLLEAQIAHA
ncbi:hypothetical protein L914_12155, partial [Phytophthora nicotianae]